MLRSPPGSPLFPYTTLFRSTPRTSGRAAAAVGRPFAAARPSSSPREQAAAPATPAPMGREAKGAQVPAGQAPPGARSEEHTSELQSHSDLVCRLLLEKKKMA